MADTCVQLTEISWSSSLSARSHDGRILRTGEGQPNLEPRLRQRGPSEKSQRRATFPVTCNPDHGKGGVGKSRLKSVGKATEKSPENRN
ncbi:hypothetical protein TIFTF001_017677 [Ficus carica]|uniref:Uncharacterized protein n=1 Tax=Ficus carica TaxID=3494 RepID=A0AA88AUP4_FICCA|nr:hypothetical protein TIFTF001_017677 [Ficus carica]